MKLYQPVFFPDTAFAWVFCLVLLGFASAAAVFDTRRAIVPNRLTVSMLVVGIVMNAIRAGWLGSNGSGLWLLETGSVALGVLDGLLFSLAGFALAFGLFFLVWFLGQCGGGDVKLAAAIGSWLGYQYFVFVWFLSIFVLAAFMLIRIVTSGFALRSVRKKQTPQGAVKPGKRRPMLTTYSFPLAIALTFVLVWVFREELMLAAPKSQPEQQQGSTSHAPPSPRAT